MLELYDETSAFGRRLRLAHNCTKSLWVYNVSVSILNLIEDRTITYHTDAAVSEGRLLREQYSPGQKITYHANGFLSTPGLSFFGPGLSDWRATDSIFESYFLAELVRDVSFGTVLNPVYRGMSRYFILFSIASVTYAYALLGTVATVFDP